MITNWTNAEIRAYGQQIEKEHRNFRTLDPALQAAVVDSMVLRAILKSGIDSFQEICDLATLLHSYMGTCPDRP